MCGCQEQGDRGRVDKSRLLEEWVWEGQSGEVAGLQEQEWALDLSLDARQGLCLSRAYASCAVSWRFLPWLQRLAFFPRRRLYD